MGMFNTDIKTMLIEEQRRLADLGYEFDITEMYGIFQCFCSEFGGSLYAEGAEDPWQGFREEWLAIDEKYRKFFMSAFPMHYFNDEIGLETPMMFKIALASKLYENSAFINGVLENLDKNIFGTYSVRKLINDNERTHVTNKESTNAKSTVINANTDSTSSTTNSESGSGESTLTASENKANTGTDTVLHTYNTTDTTENEFTKEGSISKEKTGDDTTEYGKDVTTDLTHGHTIDHDNDMTNSQTDTLSNGTRSKSISGGWVDEQTGKETTTSTLDNNGSVVTSDTPQGSLQNIRSGVVAKGAGITAGVGGGMTFNYMSAASLSDNTTVNKTVTEKDGTNKPTTTRAYNSYSENETYGETRSISGSSTDDGTERHSGKDTTKETYDGSDVTIYDTTETESYDHYKESTDNELVKTGTITDADTKNLTEQTSKNDHTVSQSHNMGNSRSEDSKSSITSDQTAIDEEGTETGTQNELLQATENNSIISLEMLMKAEPLMNKIWDIFDDIFMQIIDVYP